MLWSYLSRREIEDPPPPDRVLDGGAGDRLLRPGSAYGDRGADGQLCGAAQSWSERAPELKSLERDTTLLQAVQPPFPRLSYDEAVEIFKQIRDETDDPEQKELLNIEWGMDFGSPHETELTKRFGKPVFVYGYPPRSRLFTWSPGPGDPKSARAQTCWPRKVTGRSSAAASASRTTISCCKGCDSTTCPEDAFRWYLDLRRYGSVPHSGFGLGVERTVSWLCGIQHIRETIAFPRTIKRVYP